MRPKFLNKCKNANIIILIEDEKILQHEKSIANVFDNYFTDLTHSLGLKKKNIGFEKCIFKNCENFQKLWEYKKY